MKKVLSILALVFISLASFAQETVIVSPTLGESFSYANKTGQILYLIIGLVFIAACIFYIILGNKNIIHFDGKIAAFIAVVALAFILAKPLAIRWSNDKKVEKTHLEKVGRDHILDSCFKNNLMINAAVK